jgi:hypothetical protein
MNPIDIDRVRYEDSITEYNDPLLLIELDEIKALIDEFLPLNLREDYLRLLDGLDIPSQRRKKVEEVIQEIWEMYNG